MFCVCFRSRLADFFVNCQPEPRSLSGCLKENYADCLLAYSGLIGEFGFFKKKLPLPLPLPVLAEYDLIGICIRF